MTSIIIKNISKVRKLSAFIFAVVSSVAFHQMLYLIGQYSGKGDYIVTMFCPTTLSIIFFGLLAGPVVGAMSGLISPIISSLITGFPDCTGTLLMMIEVSSAGLLAGAIKNLDFCNILKVLISLIFSRITRTIAIFVLYFFIGNTKYELLDSWKAIPHNLPGIILHLIIIPLMMYYFYTVEKSDNTNDESD